MGSCICSSCIARLCACAASHGHWLFPTQVAYSLSLSVLFSVLGGPRLLDYHNTHRLHLSCQRFAFASSCCQFCCLFLVFSLPGSPPAWTVGPSALAWHGHTPLLPVFAIAAVCIQALRFGAVPCCTAPPADPLSRHSCCCFAGACCTRANTFKRVEPQVTSPGAAPMQPQCGSGAAPMCNLHNGNRHAAHCQLYYCLLASVLVAMVMP